MMMLCVACQQQTDSAKARTITLENGQAGYGCPLDGTPLVALAMADDVGKAGPVRVDEELKK